MASKEPFFDRFTDLDEQATVIAELLQENIRTNKSILEQFGVIDRRDTEETIFSPYQYESVTDFHSPISLPGGVTTFDFEKGKVIHSGFSLDLSGSYNVTYPDAGELNIDIRDYDEIVSGLSGVDISGLRSIVLRPDNPVAMRLGSKGDWLRVDPAIFSAIKSHGFKRISLRAPFTYSVHAIVSTQTDAFTMTGARATMTRFGSESPVEDSWSAIDVRATGLTNKSDSPLAGTGTNSGQFTHTALPVEGYDEVVVTVKNQSDSAGEIDARIQYSDTGSFQWFTTGESVTEATGAGIPVDDAYKFHVTEEHKYIRVQVENVVNGESNDADVFIQAGG